jgi:hypothetical protein
MITWEYCVVERVEQGGVFSIHSNSETVRYSPEERGYCRREANMLNMLGADGWECISTNEARWLFKRPQAPEEVKA